MNFDNIRTDADFVNTVTLGALGGAVGGAAGFGAGSAVAGVLGTTGAIPGFLTSASGGFAGGFAGTSVTSWCTGSTFGDGLMAGLKAGAISGLTAGLIGAHNGAIEASVNSLNLWSGEGTIPCYLDNIEYEYIFDPDADLNAKLSQRYKDVYNVKVGSYGIKEITTEIGDVSIDRYSLEENGLYKDSKTGRLARGFYRPKNHSIHISPYATVGEDYVFMAAAGHELIHAYHHWHFGSLFNIDFSESVAYEYTQNVYTAAGRHRIATQICEFRLDNLWACPQPNYAIPKRLPFSPDYVLPKRF